MKNYKYTEAWFSAEEIQSLLPVSGENEYHILEIGSYEGKSTVWFIENLLNNPKSTITCIDPWEDYSQNNDTFDSYSANKTEWKVESIGVMERFEYNINETGQSKQVNINRGKSQDVLSSLILSNKKYDLVYIDGNHTAQYVLTDAVMSWFLTKKDSLIIFDDYYWPPSHMSDNINYKELEDTLCPKLAIDNFVYLYRDYIKVLKVGHRYVIQRIK